ncbi:membrane protein [Mycobacterium kiyosense]|uniref:Membrane protein n=4 Tax=Mycobacteriaceae TaxID=1762 RepID=A0A9P3Q5R6_9MYCO|nr:membrane protein [Mycobacterium sp. 20KCMC460]GLB88695.1 membrane protein [Mycobacterium kiyosense]GLB95035.1 membrane protein [Mycobacterium kiyosense]GLC01862.1 membrane protein [Mycobacterium kiyosense]GLC07367.1 membrane protein [Mycobacterium kiyosense]
MSETTEAPPPPRVEQPLIPPFLPRMIHRLALPIVLVWLGIVFITNTVAPQLEVVAKTHSVSMSPTDAASFQSMMRVGSTFKEFDSDNSAMILLEGDKPLGAEAHKYYDEIVRRIEQDKKHVQHVQDFWSDPLTAAGSQSHDQKAAYVQVYLAGNMGSGQASESSEAVRKIVDSVPAPPGIKAYVTGAGPLFADQSHAGEKGVAVVTLITLVVIVVMLLFVYRSVSTVAIMLAIVFIELAAARGVVATLGNYGIMGLSTFANNMLVLVAIAAGTDYAIFVVGRYHEARGLGESREEAFYTMFHSTAHVVLGSGLTIAGAMYCLSFCRLPYFESLGVPCAVGILVAVLAALTLGPAMLTVASFFKLMDPKRKLQTRGWRRIGTAVVRWPAPVLAVTIAVALVGLLALPGYKTDYDNRHYLPSDTPAQIGYAAADRHFDQARLNPELLMIETDHDLRNSADFLVLDKVAKAVFHVPGIGRVQTITRPLGTPLDHSTLGFQMSAQAAGRIQTQHYQEQQANNLLSQADELRKTMATLHQQMQVTQDLSNTTHETTRLTKETVQITEKLRDDIATFDDFFRPIRSYFYWEKHCYDIPICWALRSIFNALDGIDQVAQNIVALSANLDKLDQIQPQLVALIPPQIESQQRNLDTIMSNYATTAGLNDQARAQSDNATAQGDAFDRARNDDTFYLPPEAFQSPDFARGLKQFISPDGHAVRLIISHEGDPATPEGINLIQPIQRAVHEAIKGTPWEGAKVYLGGTAATYKDMHDGSNIDLMIAGISAATLIFIIMLIITRSVVAAFVIVGTVLLSLGASFGLSVLLWQYILGFKLHWMVLAMAIILLLAVGSDYNLLLISRFKEEIRAGLKTGTIRAMAGSGSVVTSAGLVFAATMATFMFSPLRVMAQVGTTIALGLLFDTLIVRSFMTPALATLLGRWFWWPQHVRPRPASTMLRPYGPRRAVRELILNDVDEHPPGGLVQKR